MKRLVNIKKITYLALLTAIECTLSIITNYMPGVVNFNIALVPISIGSIILGPIGGLFLGLVNGLITLLAPLTGVFSGYNLFATIVLCLLKTGCAGVISGLLYKLISKLDEDVAIVVASIIIPIINTLIFFIGAVLFFLPIYGDSETALSVLFTSVISINFIIELIISIVLTPAIRYIVKILKKIG